MKNWRQFVKLLLVACAVRFKNVSFWRFSLRLPSKAIEMCNVSTTYSQFPLILNDQVRIPGPEFNVKLHKNALSVCYVFWTDMDIFKFSFLSQDQLESWSLDKFFTTSKYYVTNFFGNFIFGMFPWIFSRNYL